MLRQLILSEEFTSIQKAQAGLAKLFINASEKRTFYRVLRNNNSLGVLIPDNVWTAILEDMEALSSSTYLETIEKSRKSKRKYSSKEVKALHKMQDA